jgi:hypothetical protein
MWSQKFAACLKTKAHADLLSGDLLVAEENYNCFVQIVQIL